MTPPPMTTMDLGNLGKLNASVLVMMRFLSTSMKGNVLGFEPVATMTCFAPIWVASPLSGVTAMVWASTNDPTPWCTSMLFFFIKKLMPSVVWATTSPFRAIIWGKSNDKLPTSMPWVANCSLAWW